ncbi:MAG: RDD family protein [Acidobacteria bacterium]|nr:RDD family protein [Acidobacteriota bacterium]
MRCTKCHYLSFEPEPRCKNCGHDLSIDEMELDLAPVERDMLADFDLDLSGDHSGSSSRVSAERSGSRMRGYDGGVATMTPPAMPKPAVRVAPPAARAAAPMTAPIMTTELPLFVRDMADDEEDLTPLVKVPARPRPPLAVRKATPDPAKLRARYAPVAHERDLLDSAEDVTYAPVAPTGMHREPVLYPTEGPAASAPSAIVSTVSMGARVGAAAIDLAVLGSVAAVTIAFTLRVVELPFAQVATLPILPLLAFFALVGIGYEIMFTAANGQTIGKMLMGLRVVSDEDEDRVSLRQATVRALLMLPLGAGVVAAFSGTGLAVHDRMAHTRVVQA